MTRATAPAHGRFVHWRTRPGSATSGHPDAAPRRPWRLIGAVSLLVLAWLGLVLLVDAVRFVVLNPRAKTGFEVFLAFGLLFGAFVLVLTPAPALAPRLRWVAGGFLALGVGTVGYGYLYPLIVEAPHLNPMLYGSLYVRIVAASLIAAGLAPAIAPRPRRTTVLLLTAGIVAGGVVLLLMGDHLSPLIRVAGMSAIIDHDPALHAGAPAAHAHLADVERIAEHARAVFPGLTAWYWGLALAPLGLAVAAAWGALRRYPQERLGTWLITALLLLAGAQLHSLFWPSMYSSLLTTTSLLRLGVAVTALVGGILELRRLADERTALLAEERERVRQMEELAALRADFTAMVSHELATPLATIGVLAETLSTRPLTLDQQRRAGDSITTEIRLLQRLVADVGTVTDLEHDSFHIAPCPVRVADLLGEARAHIATIASTHPITVDPAPDARVRADPERIGQVLGNLLTNAVRHTPPGTPIALRARAASGRVIFEVSDRGPGIPADELARIFEKFSRGERARRSGVAGRGLGLYLSRRIIQTHGGDLVVTSTPGTGTTFRFALEVAP